MKGGEGHCQREQETAKINDVISLRFSLHQQVCEILPESCTCAFKPLWGTVICCEKYSII
jgi:hypothetical protein